MRDERQNEVTHYVLEGALTHLEIHELKRARSALEEADGTLRLTEGELALLEEFWECAREHGWKKGPGWVTELEGWMAKEERFRRANGGPRNG